MLLLLLLIFIARTDEKFHKGLAKLNWSIHLYHLFCQTFIWTNHFCFNLYHNVILSFGCYRDPCCLIIIWLAWTTFPKTCFLFALMYVRKHNNSVMLIPFTNKWFWNFLSLIYYLQIFVGTLVETSKPNYHRQLLHQLFLKIELLPIFCIFRWDPNLELSFTQKNHTSLGHCLCVRWF